MPGACALEKILSALSYKKYPALPYISGPNYHSIGPSSPLDNQTNQEICVSA